MLIAAIDLETTGLNPPTNDICSFALVVIDTDTNTEVYSFSTLVKPPPHTVWEPVAMAINGIFEGSVVDSPRMKEVWSGFMDWYLKVTADGTDMRLYSHNAPFEQKFLRQYDTAGFLDNVKLNCSLSLSRSLLNIHNHKLPTVCEALGIPFMESHQAEADARGCAAVVNVLLKQEYTQREIKEPTPSRGIKQLLEETKVSSSTCKGMKICITGDFSNGMTKSEAHEKIIRLGGTPTESVTKTTNILVVANSGDVVDEWELVTKKSKTAVGKGIRIMSETEFSDLS
jgi:DNA polymerase-3 subunit epsilon